MTRIRRLLPALLLGVGVAAFAAAAIPARADDDGHHEWREHERREHEWRAHQAWCAYHPYACGYPSGYVYAPPPVVYAPPPPPPVVYAPAPALSIVLPIHIH
jgi:hypothetical protein